jgi:3-deoxy-D-manno-octulosonic-acid transferase
MMQALYNVTIYLINILVAMASLFDPKARQLLRGRKGWHHTLQNAVEQYGEKMIWFHCASLGEFEQGRPVIERIRKSYPSVRILLTFFSPSGYEIRKNYEPANIVLYLPSDTPANARKFLKTAKPSMAVFIKYEFWYNFIRFCALEEIPMVSVSSIFRPDQVFFSRWGSFFRNRLKKFSAFFVQDEKSRELLESIGIKEIAVSGDTRFDRVSDICSHPADIEKAGLFCAGNDVMVLGSTWPSDIKMAASLINDLSVKMKFMIAPHNVERAHLKGIEEILTVPYIKFSEESPSGDARVMIIDNVGMLYSLYRYGKIAYVGGAFKGGLHNILEPAAYGLPVIFGQHSSNRKFRETSALIERGGAFAVTDGQQLSNIVKRLLADPEFYIACTEASRNYIRDNTGATDKIVSYIMSGMNP